MIKCIRLLSLFLMFLVAHKSNGQQEFFFNHYMFNPSYYNPAWIGVERNAFVAAHHRTQWAGYSATYDPGGAPTTQLLSVVVPVEGRISGFGLSIINDKVAQYTSQQVRFSLSASKDFRFGRLSLGVMPALNVQGVNPNYFRLNDPNDPLIPDAKQSQFRPNMHAGIFIQSRKNYFVGASVENLLEPSFDFGTEAENITPRNYLLMGGTEFGFAREILIKPTVLVRSDLSTYTYELSVIAMYRNKMWGGMAFRRAESVSLLLGYSFLENNKLKAGYSFDYVIEDQQAKQATSHEVFIRYDLPDLVFGGRKAVKTPRFSF